ncbi:hypothetical protein L2221_22705, partial [Xanthomonas perforans]|nr:hypothetical protein [Xanthomonas perforans]
MKRVVAAQTRGVITQKTGDVARQFPPAGGLAADRVPDVTCASACDLAHTYRRTTQRQPMKISQAAIPLRNSEGRIGQARESGTRSAGYRRRAVVRNACKMRSA